MNSQNRYYYLLIAILAIGFSAYTFVFPDFETTEFDSEVIENISKGVTTTIADGQNAEETIVAEKIDIVKENPSAINKILDNSSAERNIEGYNVYL